MSVRVLQFVSLVVFMATLCPKIVFGQSVDVSNSYDSSPSKRVLRSLSLSKLLNLKLDTSSFFESTVKTAPNYTTVVTSAQWTALGVRNIKEIIDTTVPGMQMSEHFWTGPLIGVRGLTIDNNAKTLVLFDSVPVVMRRHFGANKELSLPLLGDLDRLEAVHGPNALVHGGGAINGVVNLISKRGKDYPGLHLRAEYGPVDESILVEANYGLRYGKLRDLFLYAGVLQAGGYLPEVLSWNAEQLATVQEQGFDVKVRQYEPSIKATLNWHHDGAWLKAHFFRIIGSFDSAVAPVWFSQWYNYPATDHGWYRALLSVNPGYTFQLGLYNSLRLSGIVQLHDYALHRREDFPDINSFVAGGSEGFNRAEILWKNTSIPNNSLAIGVWAGYRYFNDKETYFAPDADFRFEAASINWWDLSLFVEDVYQLGTSLVISAGLRLGYTIFGTIDLTKFLPSWLTIEGGYISEVDADTLSISPRLAMSYSLTKQNILKLSYGRAFRLPDAAYFAHQALNNYVHETGIDTSFLSTDLGTTHIQLAPEIVDSIELNSINTFWSEEISINISLYGNMYTDTLTWNGYTFINMPDKFYSIGGEIAASTSIPIATAKKDRIELTASYGYSRPLEYNEGTYRALPSLVNGVNGEDAHDSWTAFSPHQFKINSKVVFFDELVVFGLNTRLYSGVDTVGDPDDPSDDRSIMHQAFGDLAVLSDATLGFYPGQFGFKVTIQNIIGNDVPAPGALGTTGGGPSNGQLGIDERLVYFSVEGRI